MLKSAIRSSKSETNSRFKVQTPKTSPTNCATIRWICSVCRENSLFGLWICSGLGASPFRFSRWVALVLLLPVASAAAVEAPLFEQEPFDRITLDENNDNVVLKVKPLDLPNRQIPDPLPTREKLTLTLLDEPDKVYEIQWHAIDKIELFEQIVLDKASQLVAAKRYDEAYDYFEFLRANAPQTPGLGTGIENYLHAQFKSFERAGLHGNALAMLNELHRRNPERPELADDFGRTIDKLADRYVAADNHPAARELVGELAEKFPQHPVVSTWQGRWKKEAAALVEQARSDSEAGRFRSASEAVRRQIRIWPQVPGAREVAEAVYAEYPRVVVGVTSRTSTLEPGRMNDWAARRSCRLVYRTLTEFLGPGTDGGKYRCPVGELEVEELGRRLAFRLQPGIRWSTGNATLTGNCVARRLLALADPGDPAYRFEWAELLGQVSVPGVYEVHADLLHPHVRPQAYLQTTLVPYDSPEASAGSPPWNGPFILESEPGNDEAVYVTNPQYNAEAARPKEVVERCFDRGAKAVFALKNRDIHVIDRVNPWEVRDLEETPDLAVEPYGVPLVHCLIPNLNRPLITNHTFRRALAYGIDRGAILKRLLGDASIEGCRVISGPFSAGSSLQDPLAYAYDETIEPRAHEPRMAVVLAEVARSQLIANHPERQWETLPGLVLAHPPHEIASIACTMIQGQLGALGLSVTLKELPPEACDSVPEDVDLVYCELAMWEPVVDARRLLSADGPSGGCSRYMSLALGQLDRANDWLEAGTKLRQIHRLAHQDVAVIPLWQLVDHFAYHESVAGIGDRPVQLYQNIEGWKPGFYYPEEEP